MYIRNLSRDVQVSVGAAYDLGLHAVRCQKCRRPVLQGRVIARLWELIRGKAAADGRRAVACEVMPDHVHLLVKTSPADSPAHVALERPWRKEKNR